MGQTTFTGPVISQNGFIDASFTTAERDAIVDPQPGLLIYNTTDNTYEVYTGTAWDTAFGGGGGGGSFPLYLTFSNSLNVSSSSKGAITFNPTGSQFVQARSGAGDTTLYGYDVSTPFGVSVVNTVQAMGSTSAINADNVIGGFYNADGTVYTVVAFYNTPGYFGYGRAKDWNLSTPYDISTGVVSSNPAYDFYTGNSGSDVLKGVSISTDGTKAIFAKSDGSSQAWVSVATLSTPFDLSTIVSGSLVETPLNTYFTSLPGPAFGAFSQMYGMAMNSSGTIAFFTAYNTFYNASYVIELQLGTANDFGNVTQVNYQNMSINFSNNNRGQITVANANQSSYLVSESMMGTQIGAYSLAALSVPNITGVSPSSGAVNSSITITGTGFTGTQYITIGGNGASFTTVSDTTITATVPSGSGTVDITVVNAAGSSTEVGAFTYETPSVTTYTEGVDYQPGGVSRTGAGSGTNIIIETGLWNNGNFNNLLVKGSGTVFTIVQGGVTNTVTTYTNWSNFGPGQYSITGSGNQYDAGGNQSSISFS